MLLVAFVASAFFAIGFAWKSESPAAIRIGIVGGVFAFGVLTYLLATRSPISPFSRFSAVSFGSDGHAISIAVAFVGAIAGVFGSYFFNLGTANINLRGLLRPLAASPLILVPTIKLIESAGDTSALAYILLFALSYQNGFFWERLLKGNP
jgi:uncharacterized membrane protein